MKCAQCEEAQASIRCLDERLDYCDGCSQQLHSKRARKHHQLESFVAARICDECETASADLECLDCGGGKVPLVFCFDCCSRLHSRSARASHAVQKFGLRRCSPVELFVDLGHLNSIKPKRRNCEDLHQGIAGLERVIDLTGEIDENDEPTPKPGPQQLKRVKVEEEGLEKDLLEARGGRPLSASTGQRKIFSGPRSNVSDSMRSPNLFQCKEQIEPQKHEAEEIRRGTLSSKETKTEVSEGAARRTRRARFVRNYAGTAESDTGEDCSSEESASESDVEFRGTHKIKRGSVTVEAFVVDATDHDHTGPAHKGEAPEEAVSGIIFKIKKMLELGLHPDTPEIEAQQALKNAQRLLTKHNLEQAEVLRGNLTDSSSLVGGMRVVELRAKGRAKLGRMESWVLELGWVISDNFDTQFFFKAGSYSKPLRVVFYGISQNADCAGYAFAATFNRITVMSAEYIVMSIENYDEAEKENQDVKFQIKKQGNNTRIARANYRRGIVAGLKEAVKHSRRARSAKTEGEDEKKKFSEGNSGADDFSFDKADVDYAFDSPENDEESDKVTKFAWRCMAITALLQHSKKVGEEFLQSKGIKVRKRTQPNRSRAWNEDAYVQGIKDAETIDINQKGLEDVPSKKRKKTKG